MTRMAGGTRGIASFLSDGPDYSAQGSRAVGESARDFISNITNNLKVNNAGLESAARIGAANHWADATRAGAQASAQAGMVGDIAGAVGGLGGLFGSGGGGFGSASSIGRSIGGTPYTNAFTPGGSWSSF